MGKVKENYEDVKLQQELNSALANIGAEKIKDIISRINNKNPYVIINGAVEEIPEWALLSKELYNEEFDRLSIEESAFINFLSQIEELRDNIPDNPSSITLKMNYSFSVTLMESCLGDMLKHAILNEKIFLTNALRNVEELKKIKVSLLDVYETKDLVNKVVLTVLSDYLYHNIEKIVPIYRCVFDEELPTNIYDKMGSIIKIVKIRHDIVHRNGVDKEGNMHTFTNESLDLAIQDIIDFVQSMNMYIETAKIKLPF